MSYGFMKPRYTWAAGGVGSSFPVASGSGTVVAGGATAISVSSNSPGSSKVDDHKSSGISVIVQPGTLLRSLVRADSWQAGTGTNVAANLQVATLVEVALQVEVATVVEVAKAAGLAAAAEEVAAQVAVQEAVQKQAAAEKEVAEKKDAQEAVQ
jgi:hypothetical protein